MGNGCGSSNTSSILVHIECSVKMRDTRPLTGEVVVYCHIGAVIFFIELAMDTTQGFRHQWLPTLYQLMSLILKISKHGLTVESRTNIIQALAQKQGLFFIGCAVLK